jgi:hypothetical protein
LRFAEVRREIVALLSRKGPTLHPRTALRAGIARKGLFNKMKRLNVE